MVISGIYKIESKIKPERIYIGSAINIHKRWLLHLSNLKNNCHHSKKLQNHFNKYGESDLQFFIISESPKSKLINTEQFYISLYLPYFNNCKVAGNRFGFRHSEETKLKISQKNKGNKCSIETKNKISKANTGKKHSEETKKRMSEIHKGIKPYICSDETRLKMRNNNLGKKHSEETKKKISESNKLRKVV